MLRLLNFRRFVFFGLLLGVLQWSGLARAQEQEDEEMYYEPRRSRSLSQRLEQFRKDILGGQRESRDREEEVEVEPAPTPNPRAQRPKAKPAQNKPSTTSKSTATTTTKKSPRPASRMIPREPQDPPQGVRVAERQKIEDSPFVEPAPQRSTIAPEKPEITDETRSGKLASSSARPARRGGAFELPTPRVARATSDDDRHEERGEETAADEVTEEVQKPNANVLFASKSPMLSLEATGPRKVLVGREADFNIVLRNVGEVTASGVVVKINIPAFAEVSSAEPTGGNASAPPVSDVPTALEWKIDRLDLRGEESLRLKLVPRRNVPLDLAMQWTCTPEATQAVVEVQEAMLSLSISGPREVFYGQSKIYKLTISNPGNGDAENVAVNLMPIGPMGDVPANYHVGMLRAGDSKTIDIELTARQAGKLEIKAHALGDGGLRAEVSESVVVRRAQLKLAIAGSKVKYAGTPGIFRIRVANAGDAVAEGVELSTMLPYDAKFIKASNGGKLNDAARKVVWQIGSMQPGDDRTYEMHCLLTVPGANSVQAIAHAGEEMTAMATTTTDVEALADLKLEVRDPQGPVAVGDDAQYEVIIRNRGSKAAEGIDIVTFTSEGLEASRVDGMEHQIGVGQVKMKSIPVVVPGGEMVVRVHCKSDRGGNLVFRAEVTCRNPGTKLAAEETTHFYGDESVSDEVPTDAADPQPSAEVERTPATEQPSSRYPTSAQ